MTQEEVQAIVTNSVAVCNDPASTTDQKITALLQALQALRILPQ